MGLDRGGCAIATKDEWWPQWQRMSRLVADGLLMVLGMLYDRQHVVPRIARWRLKFFANICLPSATWQSGTNGGVPFTFINAIEMSGLRKEMLGAMIP